MRRFRAAVSRYAWARSKGGSRLPAASTRIETALEPRSAGASPAASPLTSLLHSLVERRRFTHLVALAVLVVTTAAAAVADQTDRPITSAALYLLGVTIIGALEGVTGGLLGALAASLIYNFLLIEPAFQFTFDSLDDYVPLIAFNACAAVSGLLTGRLRDRALAAETATSRVAALLALSQELQAAVEPQDILDAVNGFRSKGERRFELFVANSGALSPVGDQRCQALAAALWSTGGVTLRQGLCEAILLSSPNGAMGILITEEVGPGQDPEIMDALVSLVSIALERCILLQSLSETELIRRSEELKTALLTSVSHDMRTPLSAIAASASSLARYGGDLSTESRADLLDMIQEQCGRLDRYTTNLLNLSRVQAGIDCAAFTRCDALEVLGSAIVQARNLGTGHRIDKSLASAEAVVTADPVMLEQVFYNVLENAIRYSPATSPIKVAAHVGDGRLAVSFEDQGPGIPPEDTDRIFERFYRVSAARPGAGSGLGLAIAKGFTEAFSGTIGAAKGRRRGACITVELPLEARTQA